MATKFICDFCLQEITSNYTTMTVQTVNAEGITAQNTSETYEFHPSCYNAMMQMTVVIRSEQEIEPIDPTPKEPPKTQPGNPDDPEPPKPKKPEPIPEPEPEPVSDVPVEPE